MGAGWGSGASTALAKKPAIEENPSIQIAVLLDTGDGMSGLIKQAQRQIWQIVNEFATYRQYGKTPQLRISLFEYGQESIPASQGHLRMILPLTGDLDSVSQELFALTAEAGPKFCGGVIQQAVDSLNWSSAQDDVKIIFIIGNEPFNQGPVDYRKACEAAAADGLVVNTIYCGDYQVGIANEWQAAADMTGGRYLNIDPDYNQEYIEAPKDQRLAELAVNLNDTYIAYGPQAQAGLDNQSEQDENAADAGQESIITRTLVKSSALYQNVEWDLVDAVRENVVDLETIDKSQLPEVLQRMTSQQRRSYVDAVTRQRSALQRQVQQLNEQRIKYFDQLGIDPDQQDTLADALINIIRAQAKNKSFILESLQDDITRN